MSQPNHEDAADIYVPGAWRCLLCGFALQTATLFARDGAVGHTRADVTRMSGESCPNDGTSMVRVTWQERANEHFAWGSQLMQEVLDATGAASLPAALAALKAPASPPPTPDVERLLGDLEHEDAALLSRVFNRYDLVQIDQYHRINEFLKRAILATSRQSRSRPECPTCGQGFCFDFAAKRVTCGCPRPLAGDTPTPGGAT